MNTSTNLIHECLQHMASNNLPLSDPFIADGKIQRYSADAKRNEKDEWYVAYEGISIRGNAYLLCVYGSWSDGSRHIYKSYLNNMHDDFEQRAVYEEMKKRKAEAETHLKIMHEYAADSAATLWNTYKSTPAGDEYARYIALKGIQAPTVRFGLNRHHFPAMIIDLRDIDGNLRSLQYISVDAQNKTYKTFLIGGQKKGNFHVLGTLNPAGSIYVAEGYATAASVFEASGVATVVAFDAGNIDAVIENLRSKYPSLNIIIAADSDEIGKKRAFNAANKYSCDVCLPSFAAAHMQAFDDFNDVHQLYGIEVVKEQLSKRVQFPSMHEQLNALQANLLTQQDPCLDFDLSALPESMQEYIGSLCATTDAHPMMITCSVLGMISAFLGTRVCIPKGQYYQTLYPNLWLLCVAKSGQHKTTSLNNGAEIAIDQQTKVLDEINILLNEAKNADEAGKQELQQEIEKISRKNVILPTRTSVEALIRHLGQGHSGIILASEFGAWLQNLAKNHNADLKGTLTDFFDVPETWRNLTKTQGDDILYRPYLSICGVSTLAWLNDNLKATDSASGFFARFLIFAPTHLETIPSGLPKQRSISHVHAKEQFAQILQSILHDIGEQKRFALSKQAREIFDNEIDNKGLHQQIYLLTRSYDERCQEIIAPYLKRWSPYLLKLAMIMQLFFDAHADEISPQALRAALSILVPAIKSTAFLWGTELGESDHQRKCRIILEWICQKVKETNKAINRQAVLSSRKLDGGVAEYNYVLLSLVEQGKLFEKFNAHKKGETLYAPEQTFLEILENS